MKTSGDIIRELSEEREIGTFELARRAGLSCDTIRRVKKNLTNPSPWTLTKIAEAFEVDVKTLYVDMNKEPKSIGQKVQKLRKERGFSQKELAMRAGMSTTAVNGIILDKVKPSIEQLTKLANVLEVEMKDLLA